MEALKALRAYNGYVETISDAIHLIESSDHGLIPTLPRHLKPEEMREIQSGSVFIWDISTLGANPRWKDGRQWKQISGTGGFFIY